MIISGIGRRVRLNDLRHGCGTAPDAAGVDLAVISRILGHAQLTTTMIYVHANAKHHADNMDKAFGKG